MAGRLAPADPTIAEVLTASEVAARLRCSPSYVYDMVARKVLPKLDMGRRTLIPRWAVDALIAGQLTRSDVEAFYAGRSIADVRQAREASEGATRDPGLTAPATASSLRSASASTPSDGATASASDGGVLGDAGSTGPAASRSASVASSAAPAPTSPGRRPAPGQQNGPGARNTRAVRTPAAG